MSPYLEGEAGYVTKLRPCQLTSSASVTRNSQKRRRLAAHLTFTASHKQGPLQGPAERQAALDEDQGARTGQEAASAPETHTHTQMEVAHNTVRCKPSVCVTSCGWLRSCLL